MLNYDLFKEKIHELKGMERNIPPRIMEIEEYIKSLLIGKDSVDDLLITDIDIDYITEDDICLVDLFRNDYEIHTDLLYRINNSINKMPVISSSKSFI